MLTAEPTNPSEFLGSPENNAIGGAGEQLRAKVHEGLRATLGNSIFWAETLLRNKAQITLRSLAALRSNWDSYGAPTPNTTAIENAARILEHMTLSDLALARIVPSAEGGVGFCFSKDDRYADIESSNEGGIIGVRYIGMQPPALIEIDGTEAAIEAALKEIRNHLRA